MSRDTDDEHAARIERIRHLFSERQHRALKEAVELATREPFRFVLLDALNQLARTKTGRPSVAPSSKAYALWCVEEGFSRRVRRVRPVRSGQCASTLHHACDRVGREEAQDRPEHAARLVGSRSGGEGNPRSLSEKVRTLQWRARL